MDIIAGFFMAWGMFLVIPVPVKIWKASARGHMLSLLGLIGIIVGAIWGGVAYISLNWPTLLRAVIIAVCPWICSGCIHIDGFMDVCDGIFSRKEPEQRQSILKDPHSGTFAIVGILILTFLSTAVVFESNNISPMLLLFIPVISRCLAGLSVLTLRPMEKSQYNDLTKKSSLIVFPTVLLIIVLCIVTLVIKSYVGLLMTVSYFIFNGYAVKQLGGMNGDIAGFCISMTEFVGLFIMGVWGI